MPLEWHFCHCRYSPPTNWSSDWNRPIDFCGTWNSEVSQTRFFHFDSIGFPVWIVDWASQLKQRLIHSGKNTKKITTQHLLNPLRLASVWPKASLPLQSNGSKLTLTSDSLSFESNRPERFLFRLIPSTSGSGSVLMFRLRLDIWKMVQYLHRLKNEIVPIISSRWNQLSNDCKKNGGKSKTVTFELHQLT